MDVETIRVNIVQYLEGIWSSADMAQFYRLCAEIDYAEDAAPAVAVDYAQRPRHDFTPWPTARRPRTRSRTSVSICAAFWRGHSWNVSASSSAG
jgi:hypothetical protein